MERETKTVKNSGQKFSTHVNYNKHFPTLCIYWCIFLGKKGYTKYSINIQNLKKVRPPLNDKAKTKNIEKKYLTELGSLNQNILE